MTKRALTDQMGNPIYLQGTPKRIISLVPSITELLFDLGLDEEVVGVTKYCVHPEGKTRGKPKVGGTKSLDFRTIARLEPDLILGNKEENRREDIERLREKYCVWMSDVVTLDDALDMIGSVGRMVGRGEESHAIALEIEARMGELDFPWGLRVAYLIWRKPYRVAGGGTFISEMLGRCGFFNVFHHIGRYPEITEEEVRDANPDAILLSTEPFPFGKRHVEEFSVRFPRSRTVLVDGEMFSWYGSRMLHAARYFKTLRSELEKLLKDG